MLSSWRRSYARKSCLRSLQRIPVKQEERRDGSESDLDSRDRGLPQRPCRARSLERTKEPSIRLLAQLVRRQLRAILREVSFRRRHKTDEQP